MSQTHPPQTKGRPAGAGRPWLSWLGTTALLLAALAVLAWRLDLVSRLFPTREPDLPTLTIDGQVFKVELAASDKTRGPGLGKRVLQAQELLRSTDAS